MQTAHPQPWMNELAAIAARVKAQRAAELRARRPLFPPQPLRHAPMDREALRRELADLERGLDRSYEWSDDHRVWSENRAKAQRIAELQRLLGD